MALYAELHAHSCWSLREGASSTGEIIGRALELGYDAVALTDHDNLYGAMEYAQTAREHGLRPITGCELTMADGSHLTVLAETIEGYRNLCRLLTRAYKEHGKDTPRTEKEWLFELAEGLIVLSGCRDGELSLLLDSGQSRRALATAATYRRRLGPGRFFVELQHHDVYGDTERVQELASLAEEVGLPVVATGNVHYHVRERHRLHDVLVAVRHRLTLDTSHEVRRPNSEFFLRTPEEMARRFAAYPEAISNTLAIAGRCTFDLTRDLPYRLPDYTEGPEGATMDSLLRGICERAFHRKYEGRGITPELHDAARERLEKELRLIEKHGLAGFFLVYWQILKLVGEIAQELHGRDPRLHPDERPVGRGRGSSVSSIVCYLIGLSHVDPVKNNLYLGRFLTEELHSIPDIDLDFPRDIRDEALRRVYDYFGKGHAALVAAFPTYRFRSAVIDVGKTLGLPQATLAKINKLGGMYANADGIAGEMARIPELQPLLEAPLWQHMVALARELSGFPRHISQHVGGIVVSAERIDSVVPVEPARMDGRLVCQWDKDSVEDARFVKIDFLALGMLSAVDECLDMIEETHGRRIDLGRIDHADPKIFATIQAGDTMGLFQIESRAQIQTLPRTLPVSMEDLAVQVAIVRPGPIVAGAFRPYMEYRARQARGEPVAIDYGHPELAEPLAPCLAETLGHVLYQDQVLQVAEAVAGFTPGQADQLRRAMGRKRSAEEMQKLFEPFRDGARRRGFSDEAIQVAYDKFKGFASFGFPRGHAYAFALLAYESAWLRRHYPVAFYCALFNAQPMGFYSIEVLSGDARRHGIEVLPPSVNHSRARTWPEGSDMRLGLTQVRGLGANWRQAHDGLPAWRIVREREADGPYRSLYDLLTRARLKAETAEALIRAGALDELGLPRRELLWQLGLLIPPLTGGGSAGPPSAQPSLPLPVSQDMADLPALSPWHQNTWSLEMTGVAPRHPMAMVRPLLHEGIITSQHLGGINNPARMPHGMAVTIAGMVVTRQRPSTASGVVFMLLEDEFGLANVIVYPGLYDRQRELVRATPFVIVEGTIENERSGMPNIIATRLRRCPLPGGITAPPSHDFG